MSAGRPRCHDCGHPKGPRRGCQGEPSCQQGHARHTNKAPCSHACHAEAAEQQARREVA